jgi:hypothetical protein
VLTCSAKEGFDFTHTSGKDQDLEDKIARRIPSFLLSNADGDFRSTYSQPSVNLRNKQANQTQEDAQGLAQYASSTTSEA